MKRFLIILASLTTLHMLHAVDCNTCCTTTTTNCNTCDCHCRSIFLPRSQGDNLVRQATYKNYELHTHATSCCDDSWDDCGCFYGSFSAEYRFQRSRKCCNIARSLFGSSTLHFQGSNVINSTAADPDAILADNFGLSPNVDDTISFCPRIQNNIIDFEIYLGLDELCEGLFFQLNLPVVNSKWTLNGCNSALNTTTNGCCTSERCNGDCSDNSCCTCPLPTPDTTLFNPGCMGGIAGGPFTGPVSGEFPTLPITNTLPAASYMSALGGDFLFGDMQTPWGFGRFNFSGCEDNRLASVNMILGYNFYDCVDYHVGVYLRAEAPTGTDLDCCWARNIFAPTIGINHWGLGAGITGHAELYNCDDQHVINFFFEGYVQHFFDRCQIRSFDFKDKGCLSRYMLLKQFDADSNYNGALINGINYATRRIKTDIDVAGEGIFEFVYSNACGFSAGIGYNIYGNSCEKACTIGAACDTTIANLTLGFKGCTPINALDINITTANGGAGATTVNTPVVVTVVPLNATANSATIHACGIVDNALLLNNALPVSAAGANPVNSASLDINACAAGITSIEGGQIVTAFNATAETVSIDEVTFPLASTSATNPTYGTNTAAGGSTTAGQLIASDSAPLTFLGSDPNLLDMHSGLAGSQVTQKVFGHIDYEWNCCDWNPHLYFGGEVEFASDDQCAGMSAWGVYLGLMVGF